LGTSHFGYEFGEQRYFPEIFSSEQSQQIQRQLIHFRFGEDLFCAIHPNSQDSAAPNGCYPNFATPTEKTSIFPSFTLGR